MTRDESIATLERLTALWPAWRPEKYQRLEWVAQIKKMDYSSASEAVGVFYAETARYPRPSLPDFIGIYKRSRKGNEVNNNKWDPVEHFRIVKPGDTYGMQWFGRPNPDFQHVKAYAEKICREYYPDRVIVYPQPFVPEEKLSSNNCG
jgi:hypothetical protein